MAVYVNSPMWFRGVDSVIEFLSLAVAFVISLYGFKAYKITKQKNYLYFSIAFLLTAVAYVFKIISELVIYSRYVEKRIVGPFVFSRIVVEPVIWIHTYAHIIFQFLLTFALLLLLIVVYKINNKQTTILLLSFAAAATLAGHLVQLVFHFTISAFILLLVCHFYKNYKGKKTTNSLLVMLAFIGMLASNILFMFKMYDSNIYAIAEGFQLLGFLTLLYTLILVRKK